MDMSNAYAAWVKEILPDADIIYDHFHLIKRTNDRMNNLRRNTMNKLEEAQKKELKGKRMLFLRNIEDLDEHSQEELEKLRMEFTDLGTALVMKECLRNIYIMAMDSSLAPRLIDQCPSGRLQQQSGRTDASGLRLPRRRIPTFEDL